MFLIVFPQRKHVCVSSPRQRCTIISGTVQCDYSQCSFQRQVWNPCNADQRIPTTLTEAVQPLDQPMVVAISIIK